MDPTDEILDIIHEGGPDTLSRIAEIVCGCEKQTQTLTDEEIEDIWAGLSPVDGADMDVHEFARAIESKVRASTLTDPEGAS